MLCDLSGLCGNKLVLKCATITRRTKFYSIFLEIEFRVSQFLHQ